MFKIRLKKFALYSGASLIAVVVDFTLYVLLSHLILNGLNESIKVFLSTAIARIFSSTINFFLSRKALQSNISKRKAIIRYAGLCALQIVLSSKLVVLLYYLTHIDTAILKCCVDTFLYFALYKIQAKFIFHKVQS